VPGERQGGRQIQVFEIELRPEDPADAGNLWVRFTRWLITSRIAWLLVVANLGSSLAGYIYWYGDSILAAPWYFWIFVPDCPLAGTFMGFAILAFHYGRRWDFLGLLAAGTCIKYGLWTVVYWAANYNAGGQYNLESITMSITHFIMIVEGLILTTFLRFRILPVLVASLFLVANDLVDYVAGYYPGLPHTVAVGYMARWAVSMTVVIVVFWIVMSGKSMWQARREVKRGPGGSDTDGVASAVAKSCGPTRDGGATKSGER
jgi:uncharacterized membrane protein YpjA